MIAESLTRQLQRAGVPCRELASWTSCREGRRTDCEHCNLDGPMRCDQQVVEALVGHLVRSTQQTDQVIQQREYWKGVCSRMADVVMKEEA